MIKLELYTGDKTYLSPANVIFTRERFLQSFPSALSFRTLVETDDAREMIYAIHNYGSLCSAHGLDSSLAPSENIPKLEEILNTPPPTPDPEPDALERLAAALEFQNLQNL
ncbi:MAG: hypothetical protein LBQ66_00380 [Planctomycetaceae bacterium]|jgi:hypothetical protein|nr:hypothetical protein [Planctomycetaceae bacterium]